MVSSVGVERPNQKAIASKTGMRIGRKRLDCLEFRWLIGACAALCQRVFGITAFG